MFHRDSIPVDPRPTPRQQPLSGSSVTIPGSFFQHIGDRVQSLILGFLAPGCEFLVALRITPCRGTGDACSYGCARPVARTCELLQKGRFPTSALCHRCVSCANPLKIISNVSLVGIPFRPSPVTTHLGRRSQAQGDSNRETGGCYNDPPNPETGGRSNASVTPISTGPTTSPHHGTSSPSDL